MRYLYSLGMTPKPRPPAGTPARAVIEAVKLGIRMIGRPQRRLAPALSDYPLPANSTPITEDDISRWSRGDRLPDAAQFVALVSFITDREPEALLNLLYGVAVPRRPEDFTTPPARKRPKQPSAPSGPLTQRQRVHRLAPGLAKDT